MICPLVPTVLWKPKHHRFVINSDSQELTFLYKDQNTPVVEETVEFSNKRQKVEL